MTSLLPVILTVVLVVAAILLWLGFVLLKRLRELKDLQKSDSLAQLMNQNIQAMHERLDKAAHYIGSLGQELRTMQGIGKNIDELRSAFFSPKLRGNFGERMLYDMLANHFSHELFEEQYKFKDGQVVDAVIRTRDGLIPIDSKFPVDNFRKMLAASTDDERAFERNEFMKAVRRHIGDVGKKYILPAEGTTNFAMMYIPSEAIYYEGISASDELSELAQRHRVMMTSPNTMAYFLHILRLGHERIRIEENVQKVWELLSGFQQETMKFGDSLGVLARHVTNAKGAMDSVVNEYGKLSSKVEQIKQLK